MLFDETLRKFNETLCLDVVFCENLVDCKFLKAEMMTYSSTASNGISVNTIDLLGMSMDKWQI